MDYTTPRLVQIFCIVVINKLMQGLYTITIQLKLHITETIPGGWNSVKMTKIIYNNKLLSKSVLFVFVCLFSLHNVFHNKEFIVYMKSPGQCNTVVCGIFTFYDSGNSKKIVCSTNNFPDVTQKMDVTIQHLFSSIL